MAPSPVSAEPPNVERSTVELDVGGDAQRARHGAGGFDFTRVDLAVADRQREQLVPFNAGDGAARSPNRGRR